MEGGGGNGANRGDKRGFLTEIRVGAGEYEYGRGRGFSCYVLEKTLMGLHA